MASSPNGFEDSRFESDVPHNFYCAICLNVLKQPMQCVQNEHSFCRPCITRYLENAERCPTCMEPLTSETLRPSRVIADLMSQLKLKCDNVAKGCPDVVKLEMLEAHVASCGFSVVKCSNVGCEASINRRDQQRHEHFECEYRQVKCEVCGKDVAYAIRKLHCYVIKEELKEVREGTREIREEMREIRASVKEMMVVYGDLIGRIDDMNRAINKIDKEVESLRQTSQSSVLFPASPAAGSLRNVNFRNNVIIAGGSRLSSVEIFNWTTRQWTPLPSMMSSRWFLSSFVRQNQMFVCGGGGGGDSMEVLDLEDGDAKWKTFPGRLPQNIGAHTSVVHEDYLYIFGGWNGGNAVSNISRVSLVTPFSSQIVSHMPEPRCGLGAHLFGETIVIVGGTATGNSSGCLATVLEYDIIKNCCRTLAPLPYGLHSMATVSWQGNIIIIGGQDNNGHYLNSVLCYNIKEQKCKMLPSMNCKRRGCAAVVTGNVIIVMGGGNEGEQLNSVECFDFCNYVWTELSPMKEKRSQATAVASSS